jgi:integrase
VCRKLKFEKHFVVHSLRKYWASTVASQGMPWQIMLKQFGHSDCELILSTYYAQNDDARLVAEASRIDFGLNLSKDSTVGGTTAGANPVP